MTDTIEELQARARALNAKGERGDDGDNRPNVYPYAGVWRYRASAVGGCPRALWLARKGVDPSPTPKTLQQAYMEGANNEDVAVAMFEDKYHIKVTDRQKRVTVPVAEGVEISGSIDGLGEDKAMGREGLVEVKILGPDLWAKRGPKLLDAVPYWRDQIQCYLEGTGMDLCWLVTGQKIDGVCEDVTYMVIERDRRHVAKVKAKVRDIERAVREGDAVDCPKEVWGCPYWTLHEGGGEDLQRVEDQTIATLARNRVAAKLAVKKAEAVEARAKTELADAIKAAKLADKVIVTGRGTGSYRINKVTQHRKDINRPKMEKDGIINDYLIERDVTYYTAEPADTTDTTDTGADAT